MFSTQKRQPAHKQKLAALIGAPTTSASTSTSSPAPVVRRTVTISTVTRTLQVKRPPPPPPPRVQPRVVSSPAQGKRKALGSAGKKVEGSAVKRVEVRKTVKAVVRESSSEEEEEEEESESEEESEEEVRVKKVEVSGVVERDVSATEDGRVSCISGEQLVLNNRSAYVDYFEDPLDPARPASEWAGSEVPFVELEYPGIGATEKILLLTPKNDGDEYDPIEDIMTTIRTILDTYLTPYQSLSLFSHTLSTTSSFASFLSAPSSRSATPSTPTDSSPPLPSLLRSLEKAKARKDGPAFLSALERYNLGMRGLKEEGTIGENVRGWKGVGERVWKKVVAQVYERAVGPEVEELTRYEAFSNNVYGELLPGFVQEICQQTKLGPGKVFVDLGSGVGNCVVQAALATGCEAWGFENMEHASALARKQLVEATARFRMWGLKGGAMHVVQADFCACDQVAAVMPRADVVLVNNEVFSSKLNDSLSLLFLDLPSSSLIVSLKAFASSFTLSSHNLHSPLAILDQGRERRYGRKSVSWKDDGGTYWIARVDRTKLDKFIRRLEERERKRSRVE